MPREMGRQMHNFFHGVSLEYSAYFLSFLLSRSTLGLLARDARFFLFCVFIVAVVCLLSLPFLDCQVLQLECTQTQTLPNASTCRGGTTSLYTHRVSNWV